jgi:molybdopterin-guanine dinucleotide biosynthesis protein A
VSGAEQLSVLVLAGGEGRRLGGRKDGLPVGGQPLLGRSLQVAAALSEDVVVLPGRWAGQLDLPAGVRVASDAPGAPGPLGALLGGLRAARHEACLLLACDMPFASAAVARRLLAEAGAGVLAAVIAGPRGREPFHAIWRRGALPGLERVAAHGGRALHAALDELAAQGELHELPAEALSDLDPELACLVNVNTAGDLAAARARAGA